MLEGLAATTGRIPPALLSKPEIPDEGRDLWNAYMQLSGSRSLGFGVTGPIPMSEIKAFCDVYEWDDIEERSILVDVVHGCDAAFFEHQERLRKQPKGRNK